MKILPSPIIRLLSMGGVLAFLSLPQHAAAQGTVSGRVVDENGQRPIAMATVVVQGTTLQAQTDVAGRFVIRNVPVGPAVLSARIIGYRPKELPVQVTLAGTVVGD